MNIPDTNNYQARCFGHNNLAKNNFEESTNNVVNKMLVTLNAIADDIVWESETRDIQWFNSAFAQLVIKSELDILGVLNN